MVGWTRVSRRRDIGKLEGRDVAVIRETLEDEFVRALGFYAPASQQIMLD